MRNLRLSHTHPEVRADRQPDPTARVDCQQTRGLSRPRILVVHCETEARLSAYRGVCAVGNSVRRKLGATGGSTGGAARGCELAVMRQLQPTRQRQERTRDDFAIGIVQLGLEQRGDPVGENVDRRRHMRPLITGLNPPHQLPSRCRAMRSCALATASSAAASSTEVPADQCASQRPARCGPGRPATSANGLTIG